MVKFFWVWDESEKNQSNDISVDFIQDEVQETDIGQVAVDIIDTPKTLVIISPIAGVELQDIDIVLKENVLSISGERDKPEALYTHLDQVKNSECFWGRFTRNILLPENLDFSAIKATMENNLLMITLPKIRFDRKEIHIENLDY